MCHSRYSASGLVLFGSLGGGWWNGGEKGAPRVYLNRFGESMIRRVSNGAAGWAVSSRLRSSVDSELMRVRVSF